MHITERRALSLTLPPLFHSLLSFFFLLFICLPLCLGGNSCMLFLFHLTFYETTERLTTSFQETSLCLQLRARQDSAEFCVFLRVVGEKHNNNDPIKSNDKHKIEKFISFSSNCSHDLHGRLKSLFFSYLQLDICLWRLKIEEGRFGLPVPSILSALCWTLEEVGAFIVTTEWSRVTVLQDLKAHSLIFFSAVHMDKIVKEFFPP